MKYINKPIKFEVEIFKEGMEDGYLIEDGKILKSYIETSNGQFFVSEGDYIVTDETRQQFVYRPSEFKRVFIKEDEIGNISDGSHTFNELYYHRMILFSIICNNNKDRAWKSWKHEDGTMFEDYFIVGINTPEGQYSYHYHKDFWDMFNILELENAPKWDGHKPSDIDRLLSLK